MKYSVGDNVRFILNVMGRSTERTGIISKFFDSVNPAYNILIDEKQQVLNVSENQIISKLK